MGTQWCRLFRPYQQQWEPETAYPGQPLYNFCCDFCVTAPDRTLEELIQHWNNAAIPLSEKKVDAIMDRIQVLCGQTFIWY